MCQTWFHPEENRENRQNVQTETQLKTNFCPRVLILFQIFGIEILFSRSMIHKT